MVLIFLVFCVVVFGGISGAHLFSFLCCSIWWVVRCAHLFIFCVVVFGGGSVMLIFFSFLCCGIWWGPWCSSF